MKVEVIRSSDCDRLHTRLWFFESLQPGSSVLRIAYGIVLICFAAACARVREPIDADHYPVRITHVRGGVYTVEDPNYWKTNSVFYVAPEGVYFFGSGWTHKSAAQILWKAATLTYQDFLAVIPVSAGLHHTGGLREFRKQGVKILLTRPTIQRIDERWDEWNRRMAGFGSWRVLEPPRADAVLDLSQGRADLLNGRIKIFFPGPTSSPDAIVVFFPEERILYAGDALSDPAHFVDQGPQIKANLASLAVLDFTLIVNGHGSPLEPRDFFRTAASAR